MARKARKKACPKGTHAVVTTCKGKIVKCFHKTTSARKARKSGQRVKKYPFKRK